MIERLTIYSNEGGYLGSVWRHTDDPQMSWDSDDAVALPPDNSRMLWQMWRWLRLFCRESFGNGHYTITRTIEDDE